MKIKAILLLLIFLMLMVNGLLAQESIANTIFLEFETINCTSSFEEFDEFIQTYSQYRLQLMFWLGYVSFTPCFCYEAYFIFNSTLIDRDSLIELIEVDPRVSLVSYDTNLPRPRQLGIKLLDGSEEAAFLSMYSEHNLAGSMPTLFYQDEEERRLFTFNDDKIYAGDFINLLRNNEMVEKADFVFAHRDGMALVMLYDEADIEAVSNSYSDFSFEHLVYGRLYSVTFDYLIHSEFSFINMLNNDERVEYVILHNIVLLPVRYVVHPPIISENGPMSTNDNVVVPTLKINVYPNPARLGEVRFDIIENQTLSKMDGNSTIKIFNVRGQMINSFDFVGDSYVWNRKDVNYQEVYSGIYFYQVKTDNSTQTGRLLIIK